MTKTTRTHLNVSYTVTSRFAVVDGEPGISCDLTIGIAAMGKRFFSFAEHVEVTSEVALDYAAEDACWLIEQNKLAHRSYVEHEFGVCLQHVPQPPEKTFIYDAVKGVRVEVRQ